MGPAGRSVLMPRQDGFALREGASQATTQLARRNVPCDTDSADRRSGLCEFASGRAVEKSGTLDVGLDARKQSIEIATADVVRGGEVRHVRSIGGDLGALAPTPGWCAKSAGTAPQAQGWRGLPPFRNRGSRPNARDFLKTMQVHSMKRRQIWAELGHRFRWSRRTWRVAEPTSRHRCTAADTQPKAPVFRCDVRHP